MGDCGDGYSCFDPKKYTLTVEDSLDTYAIFSAFLGLPKLEWVREEFKLLQKNGGTVTDDVLFEAWGKAKVRNFLFDEIRKMGMRFLGRSIWGVWTAWRC